jgi:DNA-binding NarL/FixJ family response regulator
VIEVAVADDQPLVRSGLRMILEAETDVAVVAEASDGAEALEVVEASAPDVLLLDVQMPGLDGLAVMEQIAAASVPTRVRMLTPFDIDEYVYAALQAGASGFLLKDVQPELLVAGIRAVHAGESLLAPTVTRRMIQSFLERPRRPAAGERQRLAALTRC